MTNLLAQAKATLEAGGFTSVIIKGEDIHTDTRRGVAPLLSLLESGASYLGASAADKVVGAGAAYLYVLLGVKELYAAVISKRASDIITSHGITLHSAITVPYIRNRSGDGMCPIECAVIDAVDAKDALAKIKDKLKQLSEVK